MSTYFVEITDRPAFPGYSVALYVEEELVMSPSGERRTRKQLVTHEVTFTYKGAQRVAKRLLDLYRKVEVPPTVLEVLR